MRLVFEFTFSSRACPHRLSGGAKPAVTGLLALLWIAGWVPAWAQQSAPAESFKPLTIERIWGQPSLSGKLTTGVAWSPDGGLLSYFYRTGEGAAAKTDIWALDVKTGRRRPLVDSDKLRGLLPPSEPGRGQRTGLGRVEPQQYFWAPGGEALLIVAPDHLSWFDLKTETGKRLTDLPAQGGAIEDPKISPDGRWVSFVRNYDLWVVNVATGEERQLTRDGREELRNAQLDWVYPEELEIRTAYWWSPDSSQIAFLQMDERPVTRYPLVDFLSYTGETEMMRYPKAGDANPIVRVGLVSALGGSPRWVDTGRDTNIYIARVAWLRDSKRLALERLNRAQNKLELLFADVADGRAQVILTEEDKYWINLHDGFYFLADGRRFLWSSERDGFNHLYLYDVNGQLLRQLTRGAWEVTSLAGVDEARGAVYFVATEKSPIERHLYRVGLDGGDVTRLTREDGTHTINMAPGAGHYLDTYSDVMTPQRQDVYRTEGPEAAQSRMTLNENKVAELAAYKLQPVEFLSVRGADGTPLHAMMIKPVGFDASRKFPVLVYLYGGPHGQVVRNAWGGSTFLWHQLMAQKGYIIFSLDNPGMAARGHAFETPIYHHMSEVELAEQLSGVAYLKSLPYVDAARIGIWGWSYGGYMTCTAMLNAADVFKAGFAGSPVTDWRQYDTIYTERYMGLPQENPEGYKQSSPVTHVAKLKGKLLIAAATGDDNVHFGNAVEFAEKLIEAGRYAEVMIYPGRGHGINDPSARIHLFRRVTQFFLDNL
ncbi:MAG TPA: DPP IV N-terminal domain-containing protein [Candidatus Acidoferrales bacterium]|nr:DPP IV N-terminal domain-containing protein [Candidatus Acidoferrales bacterium]